MKPTQNDFEKVNREIIVPMQELYGCNMNNYAIDAMVEDLCKFSADRLNSGMKKVRQTRKRTPSIADIIEACNAVDGGTGRITPSGEKKQFINEANLFLQCEDGQMALQEGFGHSAWLYVKDTGDNELHHKSLSSLRNDSSRAMTAYLEMNREPENHFGSKMLRNIWDMMQNKEREFTQQYYNKQPA